MADDWTTGLEPGFATAMGKVTNDLNQQTADQGITWQPTSGYRSMADQQKLYDAYAQGKAQGKPDSELTKAAPPGQSFHNYGGALDVMPFRDGKQLSNDEAIPLLQRYAPLEAKKYGVSWGGDFGDMDHFQAAPHLGAFLDASGRRNWKGPDTSPVLTPAQPDTSVSPPPPPPPAPDTYQAPPANTFEPPVDTPAKTAAAGAGPAPAATGGPLPALDQAISNASAKYNVPADYLRVTSMIESNGGRNMGPSSTGAKGPFQFVGSTARAMGLDDPMDFQQSADAAARLALQNKDQLEQILGRTVGWDEVYLAHQQGAGQAATLIGNPDKKAADLVGARAVQVNGGTLDMTGAEFSNKWLSKYRSMAGGNFPALPKPGVVVPPFAHSSASEATASRFQPWDVISPTLGQPVMSPQEPDYGAPEAPPGGALSDVFSSALRSQELTSNGDALSMAASAAVDQRNAAIKEATGVELDNPLSGAHRNAWLIEHNIAPNPEYNDRFDEMRRQDYQTQLGSLAQQYPEKADIIGANVPIQEWAKAQAPQMMREAMAKEAATYEASGGGVGPWVASAAGRIVGSLRDPIQTEANFAGGAEIKAPYWFGRIALRGLSDAAAFAGVNLITQAETQEAHAKAGLPTGLNAEELGMAALTGGLIGAGAGAVAEGVRALVKPADVLAMGRGDLPAAARVADAIPPRVPSTLPATVLSEALDREARPPSPVEMRTVKPGDPDFDPQWNAGKPYPKQFTVNLDTPKQGIERFGLVSPEENAQKVRDSIKYAEDPENKAKPDPPSAALTPPESQPHLLDEEAPSRSATTALPLPEMAPGHPASFDYAGKPVHFETLKPGDLSTDAETFQYKGGADYRGVTDRLGGVAQWDPVASGKVVVFEPNDGRLVIADGHQRLALAQRLEPDSPTPVELNAYVFREADGWTPQDVRAIAAKKNIQEGSGDVLDTARVLRERPDLWDATLPMSDGKIKQAQGLARLSGEAWQMTLNGVVPPNYASAVGRLVDNTEWHTAIMGDLARFKPANEAQARLVIGDALEAGSVREVQDSLFGPQEMTRMLTQERAQTFSDTLALLRQDKKIFSVLDREATRIEGEGNQLASEANKTRASRAAQLEQVLGTLASRAGPVSAALNRWAAQVAAKTVSKAEAARGFAEELVELANKEGLRIEPRETEVAPPAMPAETPAERAAQTEALRQAHTAGEVPERAPGEATEKTPAGEQRLIPGVEPVSERQRLEAEAAKPLVGGEAAPAEGGLFDEGARAQTDLLDRVPIERPDGSLDSINREDAMREEPRESELANLVRACKP
jgi:hypothetical protein